MDEAAGECNDSGVVLCKMEQRKERCVKKMRAIYKILLPRPESQNNEPGQAKMSEFGDRYFKKLGWRAGQR